MASRDDWGVPMSNQAPSKVKAWTGSLAWSHEKPAGLVRVGVLCEGGVEECQVRGGGHVGGEGASVVVGREGRGGPGRGDRSWRD